MIAGGLFSINRQRFIESGKYDADMDIWGGENFGKWTKVWSVAYFGIIIMPITLHLKLTCPSILS